MNRNNREELVSNRFANPKTMPAPRGYTQVVETTGPGRTIYLSGQLGMTPGGAFAGRAGRFPRAGDAVLREPQGRARFGRRRLRACGEDHQFLRRHVASAGVLRGARQFVNTKAPPASTAIQVGRLARDGALFEIEAVAVIPDRLAKGRRLRG